MSNPHNYSATTEEAATVEHVWDLIYAARVGELQPAHDAPTRQWNGRPDLVMRELNIADRHAQVMMFIPQPDWSRMAFWKSRQATLRFVCNGLQVPPPGYLKETINSAEIGMVILYIVAIPPGPGLEAVSAAGRYSEHEYLAREDAAAALTKRLLDQTGLVVSDYNHGIVERYRREISDLNRHIETLRLRNHKLAVTYYEFRQLYAPTYNSSTSSNSDID
ncbi:hypothetical protein PIB30_027248 [Stylosanthes scabra]|uniref:Uncharacterized protein n=1 Tax=Stylosanthes scabra TaxID=79078 RepID=A0ABU6VC08_9FABA|nr:hypothetical protein [Stylosanthes scabra]